MYRREQERFEIMNGNQLLFHTLKVKYLNKDYVLKNIMNFHQAVEKYFRKYSQKRRVLGYLPFNIYPFWSELWLKKYYLKSRLYMPQKCGVSKKSKPF